MEIAVLPPGPRDQFSLEYENQKMMQYTANNSEVARRHGSASFKGHMVNTEIPQNQFPPVSYGILPFPCNHLQFPPVNNLQFMHGSNLHFPCGNNSQIRSVNGVHASPVSGFQKRPFSSPSPEWEIPQDTVVFGLQQPPLFAYHPAPALHPQITISEAMHVARRWHSMPEGVVLSDHKDSGKGAPLFRSRSASIPSPQIGIWKHDKRSPKPIFEWKLVDSGPPNEGSFGPEKQTFIAGASHKPINQKRNSAKKAMNAVKNGGEKKKNTRDTCSSEGKGLTLKRPPKSEVQVGMNNLIQTLGESAITDTKYVSHSQNGGERETDLVDASNAPHQILPENTNKSPQHGLSEESSKLEAGIDHSGRHKLWDHEYGMHCERVIDERIVFKLEKESEQNLAFIAPNCHSKESNQTSQVGHNFSLEAIEHSLDPEGGLLVGGMGIDDIGKQVCVVSPCLYTTENWAGPAYANSPPPSSLPVPRFSMREMRSASLDLHLSPTNNELSEGGLPSSQSHSAPPSPTRDAVTCTTIYSSSTKAARATAISGQGLCN